MGSKNTQALPCSPLQPCQENHPLLWVQDIAQRFSTLIYEFDGSPLKTPVLDWRVAASLVAGAGWAQEGSRGDTAPEADPTVLCASRTGSPGHSGVREAAPAPLHPQAVA